MFVLGLQGSPRKKGNTDTFLRAFLEKAAQAGAVVKIIQAARAGVVPCKGCGYCETHGTCIIADDTMSTDIYGLIRQADLVVAASPVYFYGVSAQLKILIDRCQTLWSRKYALRLKDPLADTRKGLLFSVAASRGQQLFDGIHLTTKYFFDAIDARLDASILYRGIDARGAINRHEGMAADINAAIRKTVLPMIKRKKILFVSPRGACRAPMAAAMAQQRYGDSIRCDFAGLSPAPALHSSMIESMQRIGVDMGYRHPQPPDRAFFGTAPDIAIAIGEDLDQSWILPGGGKAERWPLPAVASSNDAAMDRMRQDFEVYVDKLKHV